MFRTGRIAPSGGASSVKETSSDTPMGDTLSSIDDWGANMMKRIVCLFVCFTFPS